MAKRWRCRQRALTALATYLAVAICALGVPTESSGAEELPSSLSFAQRGNDEPDQKSSLRCQAIDRDRTGFGGKGRAFAGNVPVEDRRFVVVTSPAVARPVGQGTVVNEDKNQRDDDVKSRSTRVSLGILRGGAGGFCKLLSLSLTDGHSIKQSPSEWPPQGFSPSLSRHYTTLQYSESQLTLVATWPANVDVRVYGPGTTAAGVPLGGSWATEGVLTLGPFLTGSTPVTLEVTLDGEEQGSTASFVLDVFRLAPPLIITSRFAGWSYAEFMNDTGAQESLQLSLAETYDVQVEQIGLQEFSEGSVIAKYTVAPLVTVLRDAFALNASEEANETAASIMAEQLLREVASKVADTSGSRAVAIPGYSSARQEVLAMETAPAAALDEGGLESCLACPEDFVLAAEQVEGGGYRCICLPAPNTDTGVSKRLLVIIIPSVVGAVVVLVFIALVIAFTQRHVWKRVSAVTGNNQAPQMMPRLPTPVTITVGAPGHVHPGDTLPSARPSAELTRSSRPSVETDNGQLFVPVGRGALASAV
eukprot:jgi/Mesvir1/6953/Mv09102-RA.1